MSLDAIWVTKIHNLYWSNGSYEKPKTLPNYMHFKKLELRPDMNNLYSGVCVIEGEWNYAYWNEDYYFLTPLRSLGLEEKRNVYGLLRDEWVHAVRNRVRVQGVLRRTDNVGIIEKNISYTVPLLDNPTTYKPFSLIPENVEINKTEILMEPKTLKPEAFTSPYLTDGAISELAHYFNYTDLQGARVLKPVFKENWKKWIPKILEEIKADANYIVSRVTQIEDSHLRGRFTYTKKTGGIGKLQENLLNTIIDLTQLKGFEFVTYKPTKTPGNQPADTVGENLNYSITSHLSVSPQENITVYRDPGLGVNVLGLIEDPQQNKITKTLINWGGEEYELDRVLLKEAERVWFSRGWESYDEHVRGGWFPYDSKDLDINPTTVIKEALGRDPKEEDFIVRFPRLYGTDEIDTDELKKWTKKVDWWTSTRWDRMFMGFSKTGYYLTALAFGATAIAQANKSLWRLFILTGEDGNKRILFAWGWGGQWWSDRDLIDGNKLFPTKKRAQPDDIKYEIKKLFYDRYYSAIQCEEYSTKIFKVLEFSKESLEAFKASVQDHNFCIDLIGTNFLLMHFKKSWSLIWKDNSQIVTKRRQWFVDLKPEESLIQRINQKNTLVFYNNEMPLKDRFDPLNLPNIFTKRLVTTDSVGPTENYYLRYEGSFDTISAILSVPKKEAQPVSADAGKALDDILLQRDKLNFDKRVSEEQLRTTRRQDARQMEFDWQRFSVDTQIKLVSTSLLGVGGVATKALNSSLGAMLGISALGQGTSSATSLLGHAMEKDRLIEQHRQTLRQRAEEHYRLQVDHHRNIYDIERQITNLTTLSDVPAVNDKTTAELYQLEEGVGELYVKHYIPSKVQEDLLDASYRIGGVELIKDNFALELNEDTVGVWQFQHLDYISQEDPLNRAYVEATLKNGFKVRLEEIQLVEPADYTVPLNLGKLPFFASAGLRAQEANRRIANLEAVGRDIARELTGQKELLTISKSAYEELLQNRLKDRQEFEKILEGERALYQGSLRMWERDKKSKEEFKALSLAQEKQLQGAAKDKEQLQKTLETCTDEVKGLEKKLEEANNTAKQHREESEKHKTEKEKHLQTSEELRKQLDKCNNTRTTEKQSYEAEISRLSKVTEELQQTKEKLETDLNTVKEERERTIQQWNKDVGEYHDKQIQLENDLRAARLENQGMRRIVEQAETINRLNEKLQRENRDCKEKIATYENQASTAIRAKEIAENKYTETMQKIKALGPIYNQLCVEWTIETLAQWIRSILGQLIYMVTGDHYLRAGDRKALYESAVSNITGQRVPLFESIKPEESCASTPYETFYWPTDEAILKSDFTEQKDNKQAKFTVMQHLFRTSRLANAANQLPYWYELKWSADIVLAFVKSLIFFNSGLKGQIKKEWFNALNQDSPVTPNVGTFTTSYDNKVTSVYSNAFVSDNTNPTAWAANYEYTPWNMCCQDTNTGIGTAGAKHYRDIKSNKAWGLNRDEWLDQFRSIYHLKDQAIKLLEKFKITDNFEVVNPKTVTPERT